MSFTSRGNQHPLHAIKGSSTIHGHVKWHNPSTTPSHSGQHQLPLLFLPIPCTAGEDSEDARKRGLNWGFRQQDPCDPDKRGISFAGKNTFSLYVDQLARVELAFPNFKKYKRLHVSQLSDLPGQPAKYGQGSSDPSRHLLYDEATHTLKSAENPHQGHVNGLMST